MYHSKTGNSIHVLKEPGSKLPCTTLCFRPWSSSQQKTKNVLLAGYTDGSVRHWHATSGKKLSELVEPDNQIFTCDYSFDAAKFVTAGSDYTLRVYDETTQEMILNLYAGKGDVTAGHSNRIFCAKFHPKDTNILVSGGWDNTIQIWDIRQQYSVRSIYRPHICGEAVDFDDQGTRILTGAYLKEEALQVWNYGNGNLVETIQWSAVDDKKPCMLYSAQFSHGKSNNRFVLAGGGGPSNEAKIFNLNAKKNQCCGSVQNLSQAVYSVCLSKNESHFAIGGAGKTIHMYDVDLTTTEIY